jgi:hypothetical protein
MGNRPAANPRYLKSGQLASFLVAEIYSGSVQCDLSSRCLHPETGARATQLHTSSLELTPSEVTFPNILWNLKFQWRVHKSPLLIPILSQISSVLFYFSKTQQVLHIGLFPSGYHTYTKTPYSTATCSAYLIILHLIFLILSVRWSEGWIHGRDTSAGIATSCRPDGPSSIFRYFQFFIRSVFLCITYCLMYQCFCILYLLYYCYSFCILYYLCITIYVLFIFILFIIYWA